MNEIFESRILCLDDSSVIRTGVQNILLAQGYKNVDSDSGQNAKELLKENKYDLLIQDLQRPKPNGFELYFWMKNNPDLANIPIILCTLSDPIYFDERRFTFLNGKKFELTFEVRISGGFPHEYSLKRYGNEIPPLYIEGFFSKAWYPHSDEITEIVPKILSYFKGCRDLVKEHERRNKYLWPNVN